MDNHGERKVYFDDTCSLCEGAIQTLKADIDLHAVGVSEGGVQIGVSKETLMREVHAVDEHGNLHRGIDAVIVILSWHPRWKWLSPVLKVPGVKQVAGALYWVVARTRHLFFRKTREK